MKFPISGLSPFYQVDVFIYANFLTRQFVFKYSLKYVWLRTQSSELRAQNSELRTQKKKDLLETYSLLATKYVWLSRHFVSCGDNLVHTFLYFNMDLSYF